MSFHVFEIIEDVWRLALGMINLSKSLVLLLIIVGLTGCEERTVGRVVRGELELKHWSGEPMDLDGEWLFHWDKYADEALGKSIDNANHITVPLSWNSLSDSLGWKAFGKGVYQINLKDVPDRQLALKISSRVFSSYRLLVDQVETFRVGQTGYDSLYKPEMRTEVIPLPIGKTDMNLSLEVANYSQRRGGVLGAPRLGFLEEIIAESRSALLPELIAITIILVISFFGFNLFFLDRTKNLHLYLGILGVASILRQITIGEVLYKLIWPNGPYEVFEILRHGGLLICLAVAARFLRALFDKDISMRLLIGMEGLYYALIISILLTPTWLNSYLTLIAQPVALFMMAYAIYLGIRYRKKYPRVGWLIAGALVVISVFTHDVLIASLWLHGAYLQSYGMSIFIICYAVYVNKTSQSIENRHSALAKQLTELNILSNKKKELDVEVSDTLKQIRPTLDTIDQKKANELIQEINQHQTISDRHNILQQTLIESNEQFFENLRDRFPNLTRTEEEICLLFRAKLSTKEIAQVRKITIESAKVARKRLRKKLNLEPNEDIYRFIASI